MVPDGPGQSQRAALWRSLRLLGTVGLTIVGAITGLFLLGLYVGSQLGWGLFPAVLGILGGVILSFFWVYRQVTRELDSNTNAEDRGDED